MIRTYTELERLKTFEERYDYLRLNGQVGKASFGFDRYLNQMLYRSRRWLRVRDLLIIRDKGCDLGIEDRLIYDKVLIHHMNPISIEDIKSGNEDVFNPIFLISTSERTHQAIHYGDESLLEKDPIIRYRGDTILW